MQIQPEDSDLKPAQEPEGNPALKSGERKNVNGPALLSKKKAFAFFMILLASMAITVFVISTSKKETNKEDLRVVVLPFSNHTGDADNKWLELGFMDSISAQLDKQDHVTALSVSRILEFIENKGFQTDSLKKDQVDLLQKIFGKALIISAEISKEKNVFQLRYQVWRDSNVSIDGHIQAQTLNEMVRKTQDELEDLIKGSRSQPEFTDPFIEIAFAKGRSALLNGQFKQALTYFDLCLEKHPDSALILLNTAQCELALTELYHCESHVKAAQALAIRDHNLPLLARVLEVCARLEYRRNHWTEFEVMYREAIQTAQKAGQNEHAVNMTLWLGLLALNNSNYALAKQMAEDTLLKATRGPFPFFETEALFILGNALLGEGDYIQAFTYIEKGMNKFKELGGECQAFLAINYLSGMGKYVSESNEQPKKLFRKALQLVTDQMDTPEDKNKLTLEWLAFYYMDNKNWSEALETLTELKAYFLEKRDKTGEIDTIYKLMRANINLQHYKDATVYFNTLKKYYSTINENRKLIQLYFTWGLANYAQKQLETSENAFMEGIQLSREHDYRWQEIQMRTSLSFVAVERAKYEVANTHIQAAMELAELEKNQNAVLNCKEALLNLEIAQNNLDQAQQLINTLKEPSLNLELKDTLSLDILTIEFFMARNDLQEAQAALEKMETDLLKIPASRDSPRRIDFGIYKAILEMKIGHLDTSEEQMDKLLKEDLIPLHKAKVTFYLAEIHKKRGTWEKGQNYMATTLKISQEDYHVLLLAAEYCIHSGQTDQARELALRAKKEAHQAWTPQMQDFLDRTL